MSHHYQIHLVQRWHCTIHEDQLHKPWRRRLGEMEITDLSWKLCKTATRRDEGQIGETCTSYKIYISHFLVTNHITPSLKKGITWALRRKILKISAFFAPSWERHRRERRESIFNFVEQTKIGESMDKYFFHILNMIVSILASWYYINYIFIKNLGSIKQKPVGIEAPT